MNAYVRDLVERVAVTFVEGFVGGLVLTNVTSLDMWHAAVVGGVAAVGSLIKGLAAKAIGNKSSASLTRSV